LKERRILLCKIILANKHEEFLGLQKGYHFATPVRNLLIQTAVISGWAIGLRDDREPGNRRNRLSSSEPTQSETARH
jgi:hypothetical protein